MSLTILTERVLAIELAFGNGPLRNPAKVERIWPVALEGRTEIGAGLDRVGMDMDPSSSFDRRHSDLQLIKGTLNEEFALKIITLSFEPLIREAERQFSPSSTFKLGSESATEREKLLKSL